MIDKPIMLMILDGFGINEKTVGNAVKLANKPNIDRLMKIYPTTRIKASGLAVGLPEGQMGNSEVGHTNIGAGRVVYQDLTRITNEIESGDFFTNKVLTSAIDNCKKNNSNLHIMGLVSDGGVHSHNRHLYALLELAKRKDFENVYIHCFLDGRDTPPCSADTYLQELSEKIKEKNVGKIATISGRYYAMDRDKRFDRVQKAYDAIVNGVGETANNIEQALEQSYQKEIFDEFVEPTVILNSNGAPVGTINNNDSVIFFNFRPDRAREITRSLVDTSFNEFPVKKLKLNFVCMTQYDATMPNVQIAFEPEKLENTLGEVLAKNNLKQLRIAETEKYAHVTFFFNGGQEKMFEGEDRILVNSPKVRTYDMQPEMSAFEVTEKLLEAINKKVYDCIILNFANPDMVGHTGDLEATIKAIEAVDKCVGQIEKSFVEENGGIILLTADHGNAEVMIDYTTGEPNTAHTTNLVPLILIGDTNYKLRAGRLCDLAPTILKLLNINKPKEMKGENLLLDK